jgi:membrane carboxypeptidase/penicillin-binding protein PbpC
MKALSFRFPQSAIRNRSLLAIAALGVLASASWLALPKPPLTEGIDFSTRVRDRNGHTLRVTLTSDQKYRIWTPLHDISPALIDATVQFEDKYFA